MIREGRLESGVASFVCESGAQYAASLFFRAMFCFARERAGLGRGRVERAQWFC